MKAKQVHTVRITGYTVMAQQSIADRAKKEIKEQKKAGKTLIGSVKTSNKATLYFK